MTNLKKLELACIKESIQHNMHTNVNVDIVSADAVFIASPRIISIAFIQDGVVVSDTIVNNNKSSVEDIVIDYLDDHT